MKGPSFGKPASLYLELGQSSLKVLDGEDGLELSLERQENGRLTPLCAERLAASLRVFLKKHAWRSRLRVFCALGARGVSLRRLSLPSASKEEWQRLLLLQIEREFPLGPEELAWGSLPLGSAHPSGNGTGSVQDLLVAALKREALQEYSDLLSQCGLTPVFTLAALARSQLCSNPPASYAVLDIGRTHSELLAFENGVPTSVRLLPWGGDELTGAIEKSLAISHQEAEKVKLDWARAATLREAAPRTEAETAPRQERADVMAAAVQSQVRVLAGYLRSNALGQKLYISGASACLPNFVPELAKAMESKLECEGLEVMFGEGRSAAIFGLKRQYEQNGRPPQLLLELKPYQQKETASRPVQWKWAALAMGFIFLSFALRYAEPLLMKPRLSRKLAEIQAYRASLPKIERDLSFLQYLKTNQPPYLEPFFAMANAAPAGTRIDSLSINRRGDLSLRATMKDSQQVGDFRTKLINSGLFATVVVDEQTPTPDRQKMVVRITGQWKPNAVTTELPPRTGDKPRPSSPSRPATTLTNQ